MNNKGALWTGLVFALFILVVSMLFAPVLIKKYFSGAETVGEFTMCGAALKGQCLPRCPRGMTESPINMEGGGCPPEENSPDTNEDIATRPEELSFISNEEWLNKQYHDETRWNTCCVEDFTVG